jgi:hypothetical protein
MYDNGHYWYVRAMESKLRDTLRELSGPARLTFLVACVQHAHQIAVGRLPQADVEALAPHLGLLQQFWAAAKDGLDDRKIEAIYKEAERRVAEIAGDEADVLLEPPSAELLLWACLYALTCERSPNPAEAGFNALDKASMAVQETESAGEASPAYRSEVDFQFALLERVRNAETLPRSYEGVLSL